MLPWRSHCTVQYWSHDQLQILGYAQAASTESLPLQLCSRKQQHVKLDPVQSLGYRMSMFQQNSVHRLPNHEYKKCAGYVAGVDNGHIPALLTRGCGETLALLGGIPIR